MDQGTGDSTQGLSTSAANKIFKLEPPWALNEEPPDQPSAVCSTGQPTSENLSGSPLLFNSRQVCSLCSTVFMLTSSLEDHMEAIHGERSHCDLPADFRLEDSACESADKTPSGHERLSSQMTDDSREGSVTPPEDFAIKLEPSWSMKDDPRKQSSVVCSTEQPTSDDSSGSPLPQNTTHMCQHCASAFLLFSSLELHLATIHGETVHNVFPIYSAYQRHDVSHQRGKKTVINHNQKKAGKRKKEKVNGSDGERTAQEKKKHVCDECGKVYTLAGCLKTHKLTHSIQKSFVCDVCGTNFTRAGNLKAHKLIHIGHKPFVCDVCSKAFGRANDLKTHKIIHTGEKPFVCDVCSKAFTQSAHLKTHKLIHTGEKAFVCEICSKACTTAGNLKTHKMIHSGQKPFVCDACGKAFTRPNDLRIHKIVHSDHKPYVCDVCDKVFIQVSHFKEHKLIHTGLKPLVCDVCGKGFTHAASLKRHKMVHTGEKPHVCDECGQAFSQSASLKKHRLIHTDNELYLCNVCGEVFMTAALLKAHIPCFMLSENIEFDCDLNLKATSHLSDHSQLSSG